MASNTHAFVGDRCDLNGSLYKLCGVSRCQILLGCYGKWIVSWCGILFVDVV